MAHSITLAAPVSGAESIEATTLGGRLYSLPYRGDYCYWGDYSCQRHWHVRDTDMSETLTCQCLWHCHWQCQWVKVSDYGWKSVSVLHGNQHLALLYGVNPWTLTCLCWWLTTLLLTWLEWVWLNAMNTDMSVSHVWLTPLTPTTETLTCQCLWWSP